MANDIKEVSVWPINELGEIVAQISTGSDEIVGYLPNDRIPIDSVTKKLIINVPPNASAVAYKKESTDQFISGRNPSLADWTFESVYADGQVYTKSQIDSLYTANNTGIPGVLERVVDTMVVGSVAAASDITGSAIPDADRAAWKLRCLPTHIGTFGRPRTQIIGNDLKLNTNYRMSVVFKLNQPDAIGWNQKNIDMPQAVIFALSQQGGTAPYNFDVGQLSTSSSPFYITIRGSMLFIELRTIAEELSLTPDDVGGGTYTKWGFGDTVRTARRAIPFMTMTGRAYHEIILDFNLDSRRLKDGGQGYFKATFNGKPWLDYHGATACPTNAAGLNMPIMPRLGFYEISAAAQAENTLNSVTSSCTIERSLLIHSYSVVEA